MTAAATLGFREGRGSQGRGLYRPRGIWGCTHWGRIDGGGRIPRDAGGRLGMNTSLERWAPPIGGKARAPGGAGPRGCRPAAGAQDVPRPTQAVRARRGKRGGGLGGCCCWVGPKIKSVGPVEREKIPFYFYSKGF